MKVKTMNEKIISIETIKQNPYQPRKDEDAQAVAELAQNILHNATEEFDGLLQVPTVRPAEPGWYELAFGHTRLAAFELLVEQGHERYQQMRVNVRDLTDLQMFELAVTENIKRRDLNPIEQAEAISTYQEKFGKTSAEAAEFFGVAASTVRGLVRLLNLPEAAREKVRSGEINTGAARSLLVVEKLMGEEGVNEVMERMADDGDGPMEAIKDALRFSDETEMLDREEWVTVDPFPRKHWKPVTKKEIESCIQSDEVPDGDDGLPMLVSYVQAGMDITDEMFSRFEPDDLERVRILANPPGCMTCPLHAQLDGDHFCGLKLCAERKKIAWLSEAVEIVSAETGILVYDKDRDGAFEKLNGYNDASEKMFKERHADLRLMPSKGQVWGNTGFVLKEAPLVERDDEDDDDDYDDDDYDEERDVTLSEHIQVVVVGATYEAMRKKEEKQKNKEQKKQEKEMPWEVRSKIGNVVRQFIYTIQWELASKPFASLFDGLNNFALLKLLKWNANYPGDLDEDELVEEAEAMKKADGLAQMRRIVAIGIVERETNYSLENKEPITEYGKTVAELAKELGVKMPKDWDAQVKKYQAECSTAVDEIVKAWKEGGK
jgi:ParB/RepB/Spo0J family partition protein